MISRNSAHVNNISSTIPTRDNVLSRATGSILIIINYTQTHFANGQKYTRLRSGNLSLTVFAAEKVMLRKLATVAERNRMVV